jgi:hypothetical protein
MSNKSKHLTEADVSNRRIVWKETGDVDLPYEAEVDGSHWKLRVNDFPDEPLFTLFIDEEEWGHFDDWPPSWKRLAPSARPNPRPATARREALN